MIRSNAREERPPHARTETRLDRYICVHGHFYQPPRENPWLEVVERQDAAYPFHDWNERITAECYGPNAKARILDDDGHITRVANNYAWLSFNIGPTLLAWMQASAPDTYGAILEADQRSAGHFGGHGSAMAQVFNHVIMPLQSERDQSTQIRWGIIDFRHRFGRDPEGMWLAETAVDDTVLELLADEGIAFTVLSPYQAARTRELGTDRWRDVSGGHVDPTMPYLVRLPSGRSISVFFYDGPISQGVAFEGLLDSADVFEQRLLDGFTDRERPQLVNIATDGESYGHHHKHGEMALAATLQRLSTRDDVQLTNYAQYLSLHPPTHEAQVVQGSSWSCAHGVERWRSDCGCADGGGRHQRWRAPLRAALDWLHDELDTRFEKHGSDLLEEPWAARDAYHHVVLHRDDHLPRFLDEHTSRQLDADERRTLLALLEMQRYGLLMYTSCGWFFEELSRPEGTQVLQYAARAIQLAREVDALRGMPPDDLEEPFLRLLEEAESNESQFGTGRGIYEQLVRPAIAELEQVGAHVAISSLSWSYDAEERIGAYEVVRDDYALREAGRAKMAYGRLTVRSVITEAATSIEFGVLHLGDHNFLCGVRERGDDEAYAALRTSLEQHFEVADWPGLIRAIDEELGDPYSLRNLFRDEQRRILDGVLQAAIDETEATYRMIFRSRAPLMRFLTELQATVPPPLRNAAEVVINADLRSALSSTTVDLQHVAALLEEADRFNVELDATELAHTFRGTVDRLARRIAAEIAEHGELFLTFDDEQEAGLERVTTLLEVAEALPFETDLAPAQDVLWRTLRQHRPELLRRAAQGDEAAAAWDAALVQVAIALNVIPPDPEPSPPRTAASQAAGRA
jgi:alpha-amylase/alpha-mannosidase (GH57 family)